jgi:SAM-dependent methyltransferase
LSLATDTSRCESIRALDTDEITLLAECDRDHWWYAARRALVRRIAGPAPGTARRALDVGGAAGGNAEVLRDHGWDVIVVDLSPAACAFARERGLRAVRSDLTRLPFGDGTAGLVVAYDVLEHVEDDAAAAREIARVLDPRGRLLVAVPADPVLWSAHDVAVGHHRRYTRATLTALLAGAGLRVESMESWNVLLRPVVRLRRRNAEGSDLSRVPRPLNAALRGLVEAEWRVPPLRRLPGVTLLATASIRPPSAP